MRNVCFNLNFNPSRLEGLVDDAGELGTELVGDDSTEELPVPFEESEYTQGIMLDEELGIKRVMLVLERTLIWLVFTWGELLTKLEMGRSEADVLGKEL